MKLLYTIGYGIMTVYVGIIMILALGYTLLFIGVAVVGNIRLLLSFFQ